jgi:hypothetical protein
MKRDRIVLFVIESVNYKSTPTELHAAKMMACNAKLSNRPN